MSCLYHTLLMHPFSAWGEMFLISVQCAVQCVLYWSLSSRIWITGRLLGMGLFVLVIVLVLRGGLSAQYYPLLGASPIVLSIWSRLPQISLNWQQKHTGQLALVTFLLSGLGNLARVFTTMKQTPDDTISLLSMIVAALLNFTLVGQIVIYWAETNKKLIVNKSK